jgi:hypothetical protein
MSGLLVSCDADEKSGHIVRRGKLHERRDRCEERASLVGDPFYLTLCGQKALASQSFDDLGRLPVEIQISQKSEPSPYWLQLADKMWRPVVAAACIVIFSKPLTGLLNAFAQRGTDPMDW